MSETVLRTPSEPAVGTFSDAAIRELATARRLIVENFDERNIKQACYELRASKVYYDLPKHEVKTADEYILLRPNQLVVIITMERIDLPADVLGRILTKGQLFSIGIQPVNTYADPGFTGNLGIVLHNASTNYLRIRPGDPIAKLEFSRLERAVERIYRGQHGYETSMWPIPADKILSTDEIEQCVKTGRIGSAVDEIARWHGPLLGNLVRRIHVYERKLILSAIVYMLCTIVLVAAAGTDTFKSITLNLLLGVGANIVFGLLTFLATSFRRR